MYTVAELIETLKQCPQEYRVITDTLRQGYNVDGIYNIFEIGINHEEKTVTLFIE